MTTPKQDTRPVIIADFTSEEFKSGLVKVVGEKHETAFTVPRLTREQAAIVSAYTGFLSGPFGDMHEYAEKKFGRGVQSMEFAYNHKQLQELAKADFLAIIATGDDGEVES